MSQQERYRALCDRHQVPVFFQPWWLDRVSKKWDVALAEADGEPVAVWVYTQERIGGVRIIRNPLLMPYSGPFFLRETASADAVLETLWAQLPRWDYFQVTSLPGFANTGFFTAKGCTVQQRMTYVLGLDRTEDQLFRAIQDKRRARIRKGERELSLSETCDSMLFCSMHRHTFSKKGEHYPYAAKQLREIIETSVARGQGLFLCAGDEAVRAMSLAVYDRECMYLLLSAMSPEGTHPGAVSLLIWNAIRKAKALGLKRFDFEGSMDSGIAAFFDSFGGEQRAYYSFTCNRSRIWKLKQRLFG